MPNRRDASARRNLTKLAYDPVGNLIARTDANTNTTRYGYDELNRLASVTGPDTAAATAYSYDDAGNLIARTDPRGNTTRYGFDDARRLTSITSPTSQRWTFGYDPAGNRTSTVTAAGNATTTEGDGTITAAFDPLGRQTRVDYSDATPDVGYVYDQLRLRSMTDAAGTETYGYDDAGQLLSVARGTASFTYGYDAAGNLTSRAPPGGPVTDYTYDDEGRMASASTAGALTSYGYDPAGHPTSTTLPTGNGHIATRTFDAAGRLTQVANTKGATTLSRFTATLDPVGNPTQLTTVRGSSTTAESYGYDRANRLTGICYATSCAAATETIAYTYDAVGNRLTQKRAGGTSPGTTTYTYNAADQLTAATVGKTTTSYGYDPNGNQTSAGTRTYSYDLANRTTSTTAGRTTTAYTYDGVGTRLTRATNGSIDRRYTWDRNLALPQLLAEHDGTTTLLRRYTLGAGGQPESATTPAGATTYYHHDRAGNTTDVTSATGAAQWAYAYEPFGTTRTETKVANKAAENLLRFNSQYLDTETGLYHLRARQYDPRLGRFTATDPVAPPLDDPYVSAYVYANNQPTVLSDPSGNCPWCIGAAIGGVAGAAIYGATVGLTDQQFSWGGLGASTASGVVAGATFGAASGVLGGGLAASAAAGGMSGATATTAHSLLTGNGAPTAGELAWGIATGGVAGPAGMYANRVCVPITSAIGTAVSNVAGKVSRSLARHMNGGGPPRHLAQGRNFEKKTLKSLGLEKNNDVWRPSQQQTESAAFRTIVGEPKSTRGGQAVGVIVDGPGHEIKGGTSLLRSTYQLRLMTYRALVEDEPLTLVTTRPIQGSFAEWLERWGVNVVKR